MSNYLAITCELQRTDSLARIKVQRVILTEQQAVEICKMKPAVPVTGNLLRGESRSRIIAEQFGVSPKTVRDIWNRKTWVSATMHLFEAKPLEVTAVVSSRAMSVLIFRDRPIQTIDRGVDRMDHVIEFR
jgi:hypothetical protein